MSDEEGRVVSGGCERCGTDVPLFPCGEEWLCSECLDELYEAIVDDAEPYGDDGDNGSEDVMDLGGRM